MPKLFRSKCLLYSAKKKPVLPRLKGGQGLLFNLQIHRDGPFPGSSRTWAKGAAGSEALREKKNRAPPTKKGK